MEQIHVDGQFEGMLSVKLLDTIIFCKCVVLG